MASCSNIAAKEVEAVSTNVPNWLELPRDITANILSRLSTIDIVQSACLVCPLWWNIFKDPLMWRTIHITDDIDISKDRLEYEQICRYAVKLSCGHLEDIYVRFFVNDDLLKCIAQNASNLRSLHLVACRRISDRGFSEAVSGKLSRLEELDISECDLYDDCLEAIGMSCPLLKSLKFCKTWIPYSVTDDDDDEARIISKTMSRLSCLDIKGNRLTNVGLLAILDGCPLLEYLDIQKCYNLNLRESLKKRCLEKIKDLRLPILNYNYEYEDFDDEYDDPVAYDRDLDDGYYEEYNVFDDLYFYDDLYDHFDRFLDRGLR